MIKAKTLVSHLVSRYALSLRMNIVKKSIREKELQNAILKIKPRNLCLWSPNLWLFTVSGQRETDKFSWRWINVECLMKCLTLFVDKKNEKISSREIWESWMMNLHLMFESNSIINIAKSYNLTFIVILALSIELSN